MKINAYMLSALLTAGLLGCAQEPDLVICQPDGTAGPVTPPTTVTAFATRHGAPTQAFTLQPGISQSIVTAKGNRFDFQPNNFVRSDNRPLSASPIRVELREIMSKGEMVLSAMPTVSSSGQLLESAGEFNLRATQDNEPLRLTDSSRVRVVTVAPPMLNNAQGMQLFIGNGGGGGGGSCFGWNPVPSSPLAPNGGGFVASVPGSLLNTGLGWINCDRFYNSPSVESLRINVLGGDITADNTGVFLVFTDLNSVLRVCTYAAPNSFPANGLPTGARVKAVALRTDGTRLLYAKQDLIIGQSPTVTLTLREMAEADVVADMRAL